MGKIHIEDGIISSSAAIVVQVEGQNVATFNKDGDYLNLLGSLRVSGDVIAENQIVSSSTSYFTQSFSEGSNIFGDTLNDTHRFSG